MKIINTKKYSVSDVATDFASHKFYDVVQYLLKLKAVSPSDILEPAMPFREDILRVHTQIWTDKVLNCKLTEADQKRAQVKVNERVSIAHQLALSGTRLTCEYALEEGIAVHAGGGSHHAFSDHGEGFCLLNDIAFAIEYLREREKIKKAAVIDLDVHQGNGTAEIFENNPDVFTFSMHRGDLWPDKKMNSTLDIELEKDADDMEYLEILSNYLPDIIDGFKPELVIYLAGADVYEGDVKGGLSLSFKGVGKRDKMVLSACRAANIPVAVVFGGGYAKIYEDVVKLHAQTVQEALQLA